VFDFAQQEVKGVGGHTLSDARRRRNDRRRTAKGGATRPVVAARKKEGDTERGEKAWERRKSRKQGVFVSSSNRPHGPRVRPRLAHFFRRLLFNSFLPFYSDYGPKATMATALDVAQITSYTHL
jgi:hypothetical protein